MWKLSQCDLHVFNASKLRCSLGVQGHLSHRLQEYSRVGIQPISFMLVCIDSFIGATAYVFVGFLRTLGRITFMLGMGDHSRVVFAEGHFFSPRAPERERTWMLGEKRFFDRRQKSIVVTACYIDSSLRTAPASGAPLTEEVEYDATAFLFLRTGWRLRRFAVQGPAEGRLGRMGRLICADFYACASASVFVGCVGKEVGRQAHLIPAVDVLEPLLLVDVLAMQVLPCEGGAIVVLNVNDQGSSLGSAGSQNAPYSLSDVARRSTEEQRIKPRNVEALLR